MRYLDRILAITAMVISLFALILTFVQTRTTIKHNHISVQPRLYAYFSNEEQKNKFGIYIFNNGLGPAYVEEFKVYLDEKILPISEFGYLQSLIKKLNLNQSCFVLAVLEKGSSIKNGEEHFLIRAMKAEADECSVDKVGLFTNLKRIKIEIMYESIYGDKFIYTYDPL